MPFVLKADLEGSLTVSEIDYDGHIEEIPYEIQPLPDLFWLSL